MNLSEYDIECLEKAKQLIDADISRHFTIAELAQKVALGKTKLKNGFRQYHGKAIYNYLKQKRMAKAMELISGTNKTIKQIAGLTGFKYENNFITAFTNYYGCTPRQARQNQP